MSDRADDEADDGADHRAGESVGSVGEEAAKLLGVFADWAGDSSGGFARQLDEHLATGAAECRLCPICRTVHVMREAGPEVRVHLAAAAASLMQAAAGVLAAAAAPQPGDQPSDQAPDRPSEPKPRVQRIDLEEER